MKGTVMVRSICVMVAVLVAGCVTARPGTFDGGGYVSKYGYMIPYAPGTHSLMAIGWTLDNFVRSDGRMLRKSSDDDLVTYEFTSESRGSDRVEGYKYELHWENRKHAGVVALSDIPIPLSYGERELHVLMREHIEELGRPQTTTVADSDGRGAVVVQQRGVPVVLQEGPAVLAGQPAYVATVDLAPAEQPAGTRYSPSQRIQLILMRAPHQERYEPTTASRGSYRYPVLLLASYANAPVDFATGLADFHDLLRRIVIAGKSGFQPPAQPAPEPAPMASLQVTGT